MTLTFRRDLSRNLTAAEGDGNTDDLNGRLTTVEGGISSGGIASFTISGTILTLTFTDSSVMSVDISGANAYVMGNHLKGVWQSGIAYVVNDIFYFQGTLYCVIFDHTSAGSFDEGATSGGHNVYKVIVRYGDGIATVSDPTFFPDASATNKYFRCTNAGGCVITLQANVFGPGDRLAFRQCAAGGLIIEAPTGVTLNGLDGYAFTTSIQGAVVQIQVVGAAEYDIWGLMDLA